MYNIPLFNTLYLLIADSILALSDHLPGELPGENSDSTIATDADITYLVVTSNRPSSTSTTLKSICMTSNPLDSKQVLQVTPISCAIPQKHFTLDNTSSLLSPER